MLSKPVVLYVDEMIVDFVEGDIIRSLLRCKYKKRIVIFNRLKKFFNLLYPFIKNCVGILKVTNITLLERRTSNVEQSCLATNITLLERRTLNVEQSCLATNITLLRSGGSMPNLVIRVNWSVINIHFFK